MDTDLWINRLTLTADRALRNPANLGKPLDPANFADDAGHRRPVDRPFLASLSGQDPGPPPPAPLPLDVRLWRQVHDARRGEPVAPAVRPGPGPLSEQPDSGWIIEVWTETELCALHALWALRRITGENRHRDRALDAAAWHVQNTQPDNATNHPWAIHVFLALAGDRDAPGAELFAQTLLHNCQVTLGRADRLSAYILLDAAAALADPAARP